jgi:hypothetical protein
LILPGNGKGRCTACLNRERIERDAAVQVLALERIWARTAYAAFGQWLLGEQPYKPNLTKTFAAHFPFFARLDAAMAHAEALRGNGLLAQVSVADLRKHELPVRFLAGYGVALDDDAKQEQVERCRIAEKLIATRREPSGPLLKRYVEWLESQKTAVRTIRLYLTAASQLCLAERLGEDQPCSEDQIQRFLRRHPGARASLFRWLTFCREMLGWQVRMPVAPASRKRGLPRTVRELSSLLTKIEAAGVERAPPAMLRRAVAKAFGFTIKRMSPSEWTLRREGDEVYLCQATESVRVPAPMHKLVTAWMRTVSQG